MTLVSNTKPDKNTVELTIRVEAEEFKAAVDRAYRKNAPNITIPGFRPGKAPRGMVEKSYGQVFIEDAVNELYPEAYEKAAKEAALEPVDRAEIDVTDVTEEGFTFKATVTVRPEVKLGTYTGLSAVKAEPSADPEEVASTLEQLRERAGRITSAEDKPAALGDTAVIDFEGFVDDVAFPGGKGENFSLTLGSGQFIPGFEEKLVGAKAGEDVKVEVVFPTEYHAPELAGKQAVFQVKVHEVKVKELPELDDEFAKDVSEFDTIAELKSDIEAKLLERSRDNADREFENALVDLVINDMQADIPACMIENALDDSVRDFSNRLLQQGLNIETYLQITGSTPEDFRETHREKAEHRVKMRLVLEEIAKLEKFEIPDEKVEAEYDRLAAMYGMDRDAVKSAVSPEDLKKDLAITESLEFLKAKSVATKAEKTAKAPKAAPKAKKSETTEAGEEKPKKKAAPKKTVKKEQPEEEKPTKAKKADKKDAE